MTSMEELRRGWPVLLAAFCGIATGVLTFPFLLIGPQMPNLKSAFGWSETSISICGTFLGIGLTLGTPIAGRILDAIGARSLATMSMVLLAILLASLSLLGPNLHIFYATYFLIGFVCAGSGVTTYTRSVGAWFGKARGFALGLALSGTGVAVIIAPILVNILQQTFDWRAAYLGASGIILIALPIIALGLKPLPKQDAADAAASPNTREAKPKGFWRALVFDRYFLLISVILALLGVIMGQTVVRFVPMLLDAGYSADDAALIASFLGIALIIGRVGMGWLLDRFSAPKLAFASFLLAALGCLAFVLGPTFAILPIIAVGFMWGAEYDLISYICIKYFGIRHYGSIYSLLFSFYVGCTLISPLVVGYLVDYGGYLELILANSAIYMTISLIFLLMIRDYKTAKQFPFA